MAAFTFSIGKKYSSHNDLKFDVNKYKQENNVKLIVHDSMTKKQAVKRGISKPISDDVGYNIIVYACHHGGKQYKSQKNKQKIRETHTNKIECPFKLRILVTQDGQELEVVEFKPERNHIVSVEEFKLLPSERRLDSTTEKEIANLIKMGAKRGLIQQEFAEKTNKPILMKDIHNIATRAKLADNPNNNSAKDLSDWIKTNHPELQTDIAVEDNTVTGIFLQDNQMKTTFEKFPEKKILDEEKLIEKLENVKVPDDLDFHVNNSSENNRLSKKCTTDEDVVQDHSQTKSEWNKEQEAKLIALKTTDEKLSLTDSKNACNKETKLEKEIGNSNTKVILYEEILVPRKGDINKSDLESTTEKQVSKDSDQLPHKTLLSKKYKSREMENAESVSYAELPIPSKLEEMAGVSHNNSGRKKSASMLGGENLEFPSVPLQQEETNLDLHEIKCSVELLSLNIKPLTDAQLNTLYHNQQLHQNQRYVTSFLQEIKNIDKHEFYDILLGYYRARNQLDTAQNDIELLKSENERLLDACWQTCAFILRAQGECLDQARVTAPFRYEKQMYNKESCDKLSDKLKDIINLVHDHLALSSYESQFSRLQVEVYLYKLYCKNISWMEIPQGTPVSVKSSPDPDMSNQLIPLRTCISILFAFTRKPIQDKVFLKDVQNWLHRLVSTLLRFGCAEDQLYLINQMLRCPAGVGKWSAQFIQPLDWPISFCDMSEYQLIDHYVNMLAMLLSPIRERKNMMLQLHVALTPTKNAQNPWIIVDSDGEEDEDPSNSWHFLQENDLVSILNQLPLSTVFRHVLGIKVQDGNDYYDPSTDYYEEASMLKLFAFATVLMSIITKGLNTYSITRYRQLNKRLARIISHVMGYVTDHLEHGQSIIAVLSESSRERIQVEYDNLFFKAVSSLLTSNRLGAWQFLADLPYKHVSEYAIWIIFWKMHLSQEAENAGLETQTLQQCIEQIQDSGNLHQFEDRLVSMATSEALYLLNTFSNMASSRKSNTLFVQTVVIEIYQISYLDVHTREFCSRQGRELLSSVCSKHPQVVTNLLACTKETLSCVGKVAIFLYSGLPLWLWRPNSEDLLLLQKWLVEFPSDSIECHLARTVLERLNWEMEMSESGMEKLFLGQSVHYFMMSVLAGSYLAHLTGYSSDTLFKEKPKKSLLWGGETEDETLAQWLWDRALQLHVNRNREATSFPLKDFPNIDRDEKYLSVATAKEKGFCIAFYFQLLSTKCGHSIEDFCGEGLTYLATLTEKEYMIPAIHALSSILPLAYVEDQQSRIITDERFLKILETIVKCDQSRRYIFSDQFPGQITYLFMSMIQEHINGSYENIEGKYIIQFWLLLLTSVTEWTEYRDILYILDNLLKAAHIISGTGDLVQIIFRNIHREYISKPHPQGVLTSMSNWLAGNTGIAPLLEVNRCGQFPWLMHQVIIAETSWEMEKKLWTSLQTEISEKNIESTDVNMYKKTVNNLKLSNAPALEKLSIYRWAELIAATDIEHRLLPLICQQFFLLYLGRIAVEPGLPPRGSLGDRFFSYGCSLSLIKTMKQKLSNAADLYQKLAVQDPTSNDGVIGKSLYHILSRFYRGMSYWLDEPRLHDANLYIPSLPPQYEKDHLMKIFQCNPALWNHFLDRKMVEAEITKLATHWKEYFLPKVQHKKPVDENKAPSVKILNRLHSYDMHLPPPSVENIISPIAELPHTLIGDKYNLIHSLRADFESLQGYAKCYDERIQKHVALNCSLLELLPELFKPVNIESTVSISCKSMINPLHKCKGAAAANVSYEGTTRDNVISRKINENRAEYKQVLIESILTPSQHLCSSAVHVETSITELLKLYKETNDIKRKEELQDVGCTLFYNVAAYVCDITKYYPPTRQFFSFCLEVLGQEFIRNNPSQAQPLLQTILQNPILVNIMSSSFSPNASPELFTTMYEDLILVPTNQGSDVAITLLTKFGINEWMQNTLVGMPQRQDLLHLIGRALCQCGQRPSKQVKAVCEVYKNHLIDVYEFQFPELYKDILEVLLSGSSSGHLLVEVWEDFVQSLFSDSTAERLSSNQINYNSGENLLANKSRIYQLTFVQITQTLSILQVHFNQLRLGTLSSHGLYPRWRAYIEPLTIFMGVLCRLLIQWNVKWIKIGELKYEKGNGDVFQMLKSVIRPWVEVYIHDTHLAPWLPADMEPASLMVRMWITCITLLHAEMKGLEQCTSITSTDVTPLSLLMSWYVECMHKVDVPCHVLSVIHKYVSDLPWKEFLPSLQDLQNFNLVLQSDKEQSIDFLKLVVCQIPWGSYYRDVAVLLHNDFPTHVSFHVQLFHLFVILPARTEYKDEILNDFFTKIEKCQWDIVDAKSFQHTAETYVHYSDPKTLLGKRTHPSMMSLKLLRRGCSFLPMPENVILHPETPVKMVFYVKSIVELLCKCCADNNVMDDSLKIVMNNLLTDVETVVSSVIDASGQSQCGLMLCMEVVNVLNICQVEKSLLLLNTIMEWIDHSPTSILLHSMISSTCRNLVHIPHMVQLTEICIDNHFTGDPKDSSWAMVLSSLQVPELELDVFLKGAIVSGSFLTLYAHVLQQLPFSQSPDEELQQLKKLIAWNQEVKLNMQNEHKILTWWWQILKLCERQIQYNGPLDKLGEILNSFVSLLWSFGEDKDSSGFFGAIGLGKKSTLSLQFRVLSKCMSTYIAAQVTQNNVPRILATDSVILKKAGSPHDNKNVQHHVKATRQCMSHISGLTVGNKQYIEYKTQLEYAVDFMCNADNTILQASKLLFYFVHQLYSDKACLCDILQSHI